MSEKRLIPLKMKVCFPRNIDEVDLRQIQKQLQRSFSVYTMSPLRQNDRDSGTHFFCDGFYGDEAGSKGVERVIEYGPRQE